MLRRYEFDTTIFFLKHELVRTVVHLHQVWTRPKSEIVYTVLLDKVYFAVQVDTCMCYLFVLYMLQVGDEGDGESENNKDEDELVELSDSSPSKKAEKHKPAEREAELAALLLAKEPFDLSKVVADVEDSDYPFFESVLVANRKV